MAEGLESIVDLQWLRYAGLEASHELTERLDELIPQTHGDPRRLLEAIALVRALKGHPSGEVVNRLKELVSKHIEFWCKDAGLILVVDILDAIAVGKRDEDIEFFHSMMAWGVYQVPSHIMLLAREYQWTALWDRISADFELEWEYDEAIRTQYLRTLKFMDSVKSIDQGQHELQQLLDDRIQDESRYQAFIEHHPWSLGGTYSKVESHTRLGEANIPDFTAVRVRDQKRDILEIKQPFLTTLWRDGEFTEHFNTAWNQAERYLAFAREEKDYLRRRGLEFDNPQCYLIWGHRLSTSEDEAIRKKQSMNPSIVVVSYESLMQMAENIIYLARKSMPTTSQDK